MLAFHTATHLPCSSIRPLKGLYKPIISYVWVAGQLYRLVVPDPKDQLTHQQVIRGSYARLLGKRLNEYFQRSHQGTSSPFEIVISSKHTAFSHTSVLSFAGRFLACCQVPVSKGVPQNMDGAACLTQSSADLTRGKTNTV